MGPEIEAWLASERQTLARMEPELTEEQKAQRTKLAPEEKFLRQEDANIDYMMRIHRRVEEIVKDRATAESLKPWYMFMCERPCFDNDYLPTFNRPNVHLVDTYGKSITEINEKGPVFEGNQYALDVLIYATGFEVQKTGIYNEIRGETGLELNDKYSNGIRTLLGIQSHGYPNLFLNGRLPGIVPVQLDGDAADAGRPHRGVYRLREAGWLSDDRCCTGCGGMWVQEVIKNRGKTNRNQECIPGYYNFEGEFQRRQDGNYNGTFPQYCRHMDNIKGMEKTFIFTK
jgi:cation diffusion facilitator CzcD-associated flavoprotein CzcO